MEIDLFLHTTVHFYILNPYNKKTKQKDNVLVIFCQDIILLIFTNICKCRSNIQNTCKTSCKQSTTEISIVLLLYIMPIFYIILLYM